MVIDGDSRGLFQPGTIVTANGGAAVVFEVVEPGTHSQTLQVHWERLPQGDQDQGFGTFSVTETTGEDCG